MPEIVSQSLQVGLEIHVELATRTKMFTRVPSPAHPEYEDAGPNTLIDPLVLGLPGALPVPSRAAVDLSILVGLALGCSISSHTRWDRKSYFYPDLPKNYQISQYELPLCYDGAFDLHIPGEGDSDDRSQRIGIIRAHLEEDAGKLLHELPGGARVDYSIVDYNRAGTPLLEIVTQPDFTDAAAVVAFARALRNICRFLGASEGIMQKGHMRFEPNINMTLTLDDGRIVKTPIVEIKNLNSFRSLHDAIEHEVREQPRRWLEDGVTLGSGTKTTRGWDDVKQTTFLQRGKEEAHDYRYFPDPDLPPLRITSDWIDDARSRLPELPQRRARRYEEQFGLRPVEAAALTDERDVCYFFEEAIDATAARKIDRTRAGRLVANVLLQAGARRANEQNVLISELGVTPRQIAELIRLREADAIGSSAADKLFDLLCESDEEPETIAQRENLLQVTDTDQLESWIDETIADPKNAQTVEDVRGGKIAAIGRLIGDVMQRSGGQADAKQVRDLLQKKLAP